MLPRKWNNRNFRTAGRSLKSCYPSRECFWQLPIHSPFHSQVFTQEKQNLCLHRDSYVDVHNSFVCERPNLEAIQCLSRGVWRKQLWSIHPVEYCSSTKKNYSCVSQTIQVSKTLQRSVWNSKTDEILNPVLESGSGAAWGWEKGHRGHLVGVGIFHVSVAVVGNR